jgi:hypothetical protein
MSCPIPFAISRLKILLWLCGLLFGLFGSVTSLLFTGRDVSVAEAVELFNKQKNRQSMFNI